MRSGGGRRGNAGEVGMIGSDRRGKGRIEEESREGCERGRYEIGTT